MTPLQKGDEIILQHERFIAVRTAPPLATVHLWTNDARQSYIGTLRRDADELEMDLMWMAYCSGRDAGWGQGFAEACNRMAQRLRDGLPA